MAELTELSAYQLAAAIRDGDTSAAEVTAACLDRIDEVEPSVRAWVHVDREAALSEARSRDREPRRGPLHGVPVGIKDIIDVAGLLTRNGSPISVDRAARRDAIAVARLRDAGAVILGKTVTTEFARSGPGPTANPRDTTRTPGGSSSGSAAAVAAGMVPIAVGTQTAASIVRPASFCGVVGVKPTIGAIPTDGVTPSAPTFDTVGAFGRDAVDVGLALGAMAGHGARFVPAEVAAHTRIGFCRTPQWSAIPPATRATIEAGIERLAAHLDVIEVDLPGSFDGLVAAQQTIQAVETRRSLDTELRDHAEQLSAPLRDYLARAEAHRDRYEGALALSERCIADLPQVFADAEVLLAPSAMGEAPPMTAGTGDPLLCRIWTPLGTPAAAVPGLVGPAGLPVGLQVIVPPHRDALALGSVTLLSGLLAARN